MKSDKSVKIALDAQTLNDSCVKMSSHMPNMEEILNQLSVEITRDRTMLFNSKNDLDYAYGQMKLSEGTSLASVKNLKNQLSRKPYGKLENLSEPGEEIQIDFTGKLHNKKLNEQHKYSSR